MRTRTSDIAIEEITVGRPWIGERRAVKHCFNTTARVHHVTERAHVAAHVLHALVGDDASGRIWYQVEYAHVLTARHQRFNNASVDYILLNYIHLIN